MAEVVRAARDVLRDPARAARLWGCTSELCDVLEHDPGATAQRASMCAAIREDIRVGAKSTRDMVDEIVWFIRAVEHDLDGEALEAMVDDVVRADQIDG